MGSSPPTVVTTPAPPPQFFKSVVPLESYKMAADIMRRAETETGKIQEQRYQEVGTPTQIGARQAARRTQEAASYLASLPTGDKYTAQTTGKTDQFQPAQAVARENLTAAQQEYAKALSKLDEKPTPTISDTPSWAKSTIPEGMNMAPTEGDSQADEIARLNQKLSDLEARQARQTSPAAPQITGARLAIG